MLQLNVTLTSADRATENIINLLQFFAFNNQRIYFYLHANSMDADPNNRERIGSVVECLTRDRRAAGWSLTGVTVLWSLSETH